MVYVPLHIRIPIEYAVSLAASAFIAWLYSTFTRADFVLALGLGLATTAGFWIVSWLVVKRAGRKRTVHPITIALLVLTAAWAFGVLRLA